MAPGFDHAALVKDLRKQVTALEDDLRVQSDEVERFATALRAEYDLARQAERTAATYGAWRDERVTQVAAAWVLGTVFVRFCEDNQLIEWPYIAGPGERLADAEERHEAFFRAHPSLNDRDWIIEAFNHLASTHPAVAGLFDGDHNPLWEIEPSFEAATELLRFWRRREGGYDFTDSALDTRFLGDLYQDLSEHARKTYALLQTPEFVEEFILDLTLEPAVEEFGLKGLRTIDPACGSGHFLLGIFARLIEKWRAAEPGTDDWALVRRSMESIHGCDKNAFATSIARFRLLIAALCAASEKSLVDASDFPINVAVGDSLLHGRGAPGVQMDLFDQVAMYTYHPEDVKEYVRRCNLLGRGSYHVVVGNPPYITPKDKQESDNYRRGYDACAGQYALSVPFVQCLFNLAIRTHGSDRTAGYVGQITANSYMKREFGKKLIERFFPSVHLTHVVDTSGAHIPGHGTPTVILVGRNFAARMNEPVLAVLGIRGEPVVPDIPSEGLAWQAIVRQVGVPGSESDWVSVDYIPRKSLASHPWSLSGGGASGLMEALESSCSQPLRARVSSIGFCATTREDDAYLVGPALGRRMNLSSAHIRPMASGVDIRDWRNAGAELVIFPYSEDRSAAIGGSEERALWPNRLLLKLRRALSGTQEEQGLTWFEYSSFSPSRYWAGHLISFSFVSTHAHFSLSRSEYVFIRSAPVIKMLDGASEDDHLALLGLLNSSLACFWLKQVSQDKGNRGGERSTGRYAWESYFEFTGTKLLEFPVPENLPLDLGCRMDDLSQRLRECEPSVALRSVVPTRAQLDLLMRDFGRIRRKMIALQEELDWHVYALYGLISGNEVRALTAQDLDSVPEIDLGERSFEILIARDAGVDEAIGQWFARHGSAPITEIPGCWPEWYRSIVSARIDVVEKRKDVALVERPECKRRWVEQEWEKKEAEALRTWLLGRCEKVDMWFGRREGMKQPRALTVSQLADQFKDDADMHSVAQLYATDHLKKRDLTLAQILEQVIADQHVPYLAAMRYKDSGLRKRQQWEETWELQREEDRTGKRLDIAVPPKYTSADFKKTSYWSQRGKLDVPKERFISYPDANPDSDPTLLLGWAGWDHKDQAQALVNIVNDRTDQAGWGTDKIQPLLAGLLEAMPWVKQWHGEYDDEWGGNPAEEYQAFLDGQRAKHQLTEDDLRGWRPAAATRGRKKG
ncbi:BREX-2 system adenine-specific DNA-methyltransferase PglX [Lentzea sp. DG1S-22]|uniref:BREX-2 system adenine-specific DNA-methyltransferase PglX n=1 Tax=Lentzea sp. DG1S-22 TaxID=3108822 RepID=UPI002E78886F|nr:BREX-2 system adenine-specific DNA-methyltransferase PglX [Lentzea sp. DG1S-22]WVH77701.1 BREX-2 system adenine-specific DNA-methyltransferase PglX [Lentzea sp. DG1S-22]